MITKLVSENFKRVTTVTIEPGGAGAVVIAGDNAEGKSSGGCDAIAFALGGAKHAPEEPLRKGAKKGGVILETEDFTVKRSITKKGTTLKVEGKDGSRYSSPQKMLDALFDSISFDPLEFERMKPAERAKAVAHLAGLDFATEDSARKEAYDKRTEIGRDIKRLTGAIEQLGDLPDGPAEEVSVADLAAELDAKADQNRRNEARRRELEQLRDLAMKQQAQIDDLAEQLAAARQAFENTGKKGKELSAEVKVLEDHDLEEVRARINSIEETNAAARDIAKRDELQAELDGAIEKSEGLTQRIEEIDGIKADAIAKAKYPIDGLEAGEEDVLYNGLPFSQASQAERLRVSMAIGIAQNPGIGVVLARDGSRFDDGNLALIDSMAKEAGIQCWVEVVGDRAAATVVIEDGKVKG